MNAPDSDAKPAAADDPRLAWARLWSRIAWIAGVFTAALGILLLANTFRLYRGWGNGKVRVVEAAELLPLKSALRQDPKNDELKQQIRLLDQQLRHEYFRREHLASRGGVMLLGGAVVFLTALAASRQLRRPKLPAPALPLRREDPARRARVAANAVAGAALAAAGVGVAMLRDTAPQWRPAPTAGGAAAAGGDEPAAATDGYPDAAEIAANWPYFRGPSGSGIIEMKGLPESWDAGSGKNVLWKSEIALPGENSAVVWGGRVFLTGADEKRRELYCYDANDGKLLWKEPVTTPQSEAAEPPEVMEDTGHAAPTAATDGRRVFAMFASGDLGGFSVDGKKLWIRHLGTPENMYGHASSLRLWRDRVIVVFDQGQAEDAKSKILALDAATGEPVWTTPRPVANSWVSPIIIHHQGREQIITAADPWVMAYDPAGGKELWRAKCLRGDVAPSPVYANDMVYVACDQTCIAAIRPDGNGDVTETHIAWKQEDAGLPDMSSLLCDGPRIYTLVFGVFYAFDALTGEARWEHKTDAKFQASPTLVNGRIHLPAGDGTTIIGEATNDGFKETGRAGIGEKIGASPAFANGRMYLRGSKHLFCIGTP